MKKKKRDLFIALSKSYLKWIMLSSNDLYIILPSMFNWF